MFDAESGLVFHSEQTYQLLSESDRENTHSIRKIFDDLWVRLGVGEASISGFDFEAEIGCNNTFTRDYLEIGYTIGLQPLRRIEEDVVRKLWMLALEITSDGLRYWMFIGSGDRVNQS